MPARRVTVKVKGPVAKGILTGTSYQPGRYPPADDPCVYCTGPADTDEHLTPQADGGRRANNIVRACAHCNRRRNRQPLLHYLLENNT